MPDYSVAKRLQGGLLACRAPLDELDDANAPAMPERTQGEAECSRRFTLTGASIDHQESLLDGFGRLFRVLHLLTLGHFGAMALGFIDIRFCHGYLPDGSAGRDRIIPRRSR